MNNQPYMLLNRLVLRGVTKNYEARFKSGLNVIWGDMDTGKSSILNLIDYCLGGSNNQLQYAEIVSNTRVAYLEADLNGTTVTIERDLTDTKGPVRVYSCSYDEVGRVFPRFMSASPGESMPDGWLSNFILECLSIPRVLIKESRKDDANSDRLSFRDLMKLIYLKQTKVGSDGLLDHGNPIVFNKNVEVQKFVFNIHSELLTQLRGELAFEAGEQRALLAERDAVHKFLSAINVSVDGKKSSSERAEIKQIELENVELDIKRLKSSFALTSELAVEMKKALSILRSELVRVTEKISEVTRKRDNFARLRETYLLDFDNLKAASYAHEVLGSLPELDKSLTCPLCSSSVTINLACAEPKVIDNEIRSLKNRITGLDEAIDRTKTKIIELQKEQSEISNTLQAKTSGFDRENFAELSGLVQSIEELEKVRTTIGIECAEIERTEAISHRFDDIDKQLQNKAVTIERIKRAIKDAETGATNPNAVFEMLSGLFSSYMHHSGLKNVFDAYVDSRFTPYFRNISYYQTSSGGVRTIASVGAFLVRLLYLLDKGGQLPSLLMIDTPGQNIGRYKRYDDSESTDPAVYEKIYEQILAVINFAKERELPCQVIMVDNDLPSILKEGENFHLVKRFDKGNSNHERGLVYDAAAM